MIGLAYPEIEPVAFKDERLPCFFSWVLLSSTADIFYLFYLIFFVYKFFY